MSLANKVVLITGSTAGLGRAIAQRANAESAIVVINHRSDSSATTAAELVTSFGGPERAIAVQADASSVAGAEKMVAAAVEKFGRIDVCVANAGLMTMRGVVTGGEGGASEQEFDDMVNINVKGPFFLAQKVVPHMPKGGRLIFISSTTVAITSIMPSYLLYTACKAAVEQMAFMLAKELAPKGILANAVAPGPIATELFFKGKTEQMVNAVKAMNPYNRLAEPEEIASVVAFLAGDDGRWVNGQTVRVNGGVA